MREKKQFEDEAQEGGGRFLTRHSSTSILDFFGCCSSTPTDLNERLPNLDRNQSQKISIKNVMKKSMVYGTPSQIAFDSPNRFESNKKEQETRTVINRKYSNYTQLSGSLIKNQSEKTIPNNSTQRVNFMYNNEQSQTGVRNYHTTNVIFEKYIVKPQEMNVYVNQHNQNVNYTHKNYDFAPHEDFYQQQIQRQQIPQRSYEQHEFLPPQNNIHAKIDNNSCHYSFGQQQKKFLMNQFAGFRQVLSNRPSKQSARDRDSGYQSPKYQQQVSPYSFLKMERGNLNSLVRNVQVMDEEYDYSESDKSQVIDSYQNMMSRIHENSSEFPPNSYRQNF